MIYDHQMTIKGHPDDGVIPVLPHTRDPYWVTNEPADVLAPNGARVSICIVLTTMLHTFPNVYFVIYDFE